MTLEIALSIRRGEGVIYKLPWGTLDYPEVPWSTPGSREYPGGLGGTQGGPGVPGGGGIGPPPALQKSISVPQCHLIPVHDFPVLFNLDIGTTFRPKGPPRWPLAASRHLEDLI